MAFGQRTLIFQLNVSGAKVNSSSVTSPISITVLPGSVKMTSILVDSFCHTNVQDHFQCLLSTCKGSCVDGEMAELVLFAKLRSVLQL